MDLEKHINIIIEQERKEIKNYSIFTIGVILVFFLLLCFNLMFGFVKDIATALTNFLVLAIGYIPFQQIMKRRRRIKLFDNIVRDGISGNKADQKKYEVYISEVIKEAIKN